MLQEDNMEEQSVGQCPHCGNRTPQELKGVCSSLHNKDGSHHFFMTQCQTCAEGLLYKQVDEYSSMPELSHGRFDIAKYELVWPAPAGLHPCVPQSIKNIYLEAAAIKALAPNAFANQIRRALEGLCLDRGATKRTLALNLSELSDRGEIPETLTEMTGVLRKLGNVGSHAGEETISSDYVDVIDDFFRAIIEYVYIAPHKVNEFKARLEYAQKTAVK